MKKVLILRPNYLIHSCLLFFLFISLVISHWFKLQNLVSFLINFTMGSLVSIHFKRLRGLYTCNARNILLAIWIWIITRKVLNLLFKWQFSSKLFNLAKLILIFLTICQCNHTDQFWSVIADVDKNCLMWHSRYWCKQLFLWYFNFFNFLFPPSSFADCHGQ